MLSTATYLACSDDGTSADSSDGGKDGSGFDEDSGEPQVVGGEGGEGGEGGGGSAGKGGSGGKGGTGGGGGSGGMVMMQLDACAPGTATPALDAGGLCGATDFGLPAINFKTGATEVLTGGALPAGVYDAVIAERSSDAATGSWRETFVVDGKGKFTRYRILDSMSNNPPPTSRSGTYTLDDAGTLTLNTTCIGGDAGTGTDNLKYQVVQDSCGTRLRIGLLGFEVTLRKR